MSHTPHHKRHAAPHGASDAFIKRVSVAAQLSETRTGVPASITIAQAILESGWGQSHSGSANNYFGVKAQERRGKVNFGKVATGYVDLPTKEVLKSGEKVTVIAHFRSYATMSDSFVDHGQFIKENHRYSAGLTAYAASGDADAFAHSLQRAHYGTDHGYAASLIGLMRQHSLYKYNINQKTAADKSKD